MKLVRYVLSLAVVALVGWLLLAWFVDGYFGGNIFPNGGEPDSWSAPDSWQEWRDIVIVLMAIFWTLAGVLAVAVGIALLFLVGMTRKVLRENAAPALDSLRDSLDNVRGTTEYAGEAVVSPLIRAYAVVKGVRSGVGAISHIGDRIRGRKGKKR